MLIKKVYYRKQNGSLVETFGKDMEDKEKNVFLSRLPFETQQEVSFWNQEKTNQIAYKMSTDFIQWLIEETIKGNWNGEELGAAFCQLDSIISARNSILNTMFHSPIQYLKSRKRSNKRRKLSWLITSQRRKLTRSRYEAGINRHRILASLFPTLLH